MDHPVYMSLDLHPRHAHTTLSPYQRHKYAVHRLCPLGCSRQYCAALCSSSSSSRYSVIAAHRGLFQNASTTIHIQNVAHFSFTYLSITDFYLPEILRRILQLCTGYLPTVQAGIRLTGKETSQFI